MLQNNKVTAIILAAGNSTRFGGNRNKNFELIKGKAVILYSIETFYKSNYINNQLIAYKGNKEESHR